MTTDAFTTAARAYARERYPTGTDLDRDRRMVVDEFAVWARDHLAAQEPRVTLHREDGKPTTCEVRRGGMLIFAGRDYISDIQVTQGTTDAEIEAAIDALRRNTGDDMSARDARIMLTAAKEARA